MSKLPGDVRKRKEATEKALRTIDGDLQEKVATYVAPYSNSLFHRKAVEWIAATDQVSRILYHIFLSTYCHSQPIQALEHPKFKELVDVASRARNGVVIPGRKATRGEIKRIFKDYLTGLRSELNVRFFPTRHLSDFISYILHCRVGLSKAGSA